jgi:hypothetical protein
VAGSLRQRAGLSPARHAAVDQTRVARGAVQRPKAQALHHAGAHAFDQRICMFDEAQHQLAALCCLDVSCDGALAAVEHSEWCAGRCLTFHRDDVCPQISHVHRAKGPGADGAYFNDPDAFEHSSCLLVVS